MGSRNDCTTTDDDEQVSRAKLPNIRAEALKDLGRFDDALVLLEEAVGINRRQHSVDLAINLHNKTGILRALGRFDDAMDTIQEALKINLSVYVTNTHSTIISLA